MGGLGFLFSIVFYVALSLLAIIFTKPWWGRLAVLMFVVLLPTADAVYGRYKLKQMCAEEAGTKIYRTVENVDGFLGYASKEFIEKYGYQFVEYCRFKSKSHCYRRHMQNGVLVKSEKVKLISKFQIREYGFEPDYKKKYWKQVEVIETYPEGETLAKYTNISFIGGWAEHFLRSFADAGAGTVASCSKKSFDTKAFILSVLKP